MNRKNFIRCIVKKLNYKYFFVILKIIYKLNTYTYVSVSLKKLRSTNSTRSEEMSVESQRFWTKCNDLKSLGEQNYRAILAVSLNLT